MPNFPGRPQRTAMIPIGPDATGATKLSVDRLRETDAKALHPSPQVATSFGFDEQVEVVPLHREVNDSEAPPRPHRQRASHGGKQPSATKGRQSAANAHRHVQWLTPVVDWPQAMRNTRDASCRLPACPSTTTASPVKPKLPLSWSTHH